MTSDKARPRRLYRRLLEQARPHWHWIGLYVLVSLLGTPLALLLPLPVKLAVDHVIGSQPGPAWVHAVLPIDWTDARVGAIAVAALVVLFTGLTLCQQMTLVLLRTVVGEKLMMSFRERLFRHAQRLSLSYHDTTGSADSIYRIQSDASAVQSLVTESFVPLVSAAVMVCSMLVVTARLNLHLALIGLAVCPPLILITAAFRPRLRRQWREVKAIESAVQSVVQEVLGSVRVVKAFNREEHETSRFRAHYSRGVAARIKASMQETCYTFSTGLTVAVGTAAVLLVGVADVRSGDLPLGDMLLITAYLKHLYDPLKTIGRQLTSRQKALASAERAFRLLDEVTEVPERPDALPLVHPNGAVSFENVSFAYPTGPRVLTGVSFDVPAGTRVGIVGATGAGKSTLLNLLTRFYDPVEGRILLDDVDLRDYRLADVRRQFAIVLQDPVLFSTTIGENIAYGRPGASEAEIIEAARAADVHDFIASLPDGYDTLVGERGMRLSGGERQRISLARAFLKSAAILILDEPTSSVDPQTERAIMAAMERLMRGRTTFMIAHRLGTLRHCGLLLRVENGVVRAGTVAELERMIALESAVQNDGRSHMSNRAALIGTLAAGDHHQHPAAIAWSSLRPNGARPNAVTVLKAQFKPEHKSGVYRLHGVLPDRSSVVAKRCLRETGVVERRIHEEVLPSLSLSRLGFFGVLDEGPEQDSMWLFMQDAGDADVPADQRVLVVRWLAQLHTSAADDATVQAAQLPDRGLAHYRERMHTSSERLRATLSQRTEPDRVRARTILQQNLAMLDRLDAKWAKLVEAAGAMPPTLVHGDFVPKNVRICTRSDAPEVYVLDWETAGWGTPAADLASLGIARFAAPADAIEIYVSVVCERWPDVDTAAVTQMRNAGILLRWIAAVDWATYSLGWGWDDRPLSMLETYTNRVRDMLGASAGLDLL